jgi:molybdate transport system ATP-binding protein
MPAETAWELDFGLTLGPLALDVQIAGGTRTVALVGPNGSGKTTVLRTVAGAHAPVRGTIKVGARVLFDARNQVDVAPELRRVGYVPQGHGLFPHLSALDNVAFGHTKGQNALTKRRRAEELLTELGYRSVAQHKPSQLSGGESQRVALARALMIEPELLLLDEPLASLDIAARRSLRTLLAEHLQAAGRPAIVVTHDVRDVLALDAHVVVLEAGRVVQQGDLSALQASPATAFVAEFCHAP